MRLGTLRLRRRVWPSLIDTPICLITLLSTSGTWPSSCASVRSAINLIKSRTLRGNATTPCLASLLCMTCCSGQCPDFMLFQFHKSTTFKATRQHHGAVTDTDKPADGVPYCLKHAPDFAVSSFRQRYLVPAISTFSTTRFKRRELRHTIVKRHTFKQALFFFIVQRAQHTHSVFAFQAKTRVHQPVGELT